MAYYNGCSGSLWYTPSGTTTTKPIAKVRDWSLECSVELIDTATIDNCSSNFVPGRKSATGSATLLYYRLETSESVSNYQFTELLSKIHKVGHVSESDRVLLTLKVGTLPGDDIQFYAYITSAQLGVTTNELSQVQIQFTVDGDFLSGGVIA